MSPLLAKNFKMGDEAQQYIQEARARALARAQSVAGEPPCEPQPTPPVSPPPGGACPIRGPKPRGVQNLLDELLIMSPPASSSTPAGATRKRLPEPFETEYHPRLYCPAYPAKRPSSINVRTRLSETPRTPQTTIPERSRVDKYFSEFKGTQEQVDNLAKSLSHVSADPEDYIIDKISPYRGTVEVFEETPTAGIRGLLKTPASTSSGRKNRLYIMRKTTTVTIPQERRQTEELGKPLPETYIYQPGDPLYNIAEDQLLPPRSFVASPYIPYHQGPHYTRTPRQLRNRLELETEDERRQDHVHSREPKREIEKHFGAIDFDKFIMPRRYLKQKKKEPQAMWDRRRKRTSQQQCKPCS